MYPVPPLSNVRKINLISLIVPKSKTGITVLQAHGFFKIRKDTDNYNHYIVFNMFSAVSRKHPTHISITFHSW